MEEWKFLYVILKLCAEFLFPTMTTIGQKVCGWRGGGSAVAAGSKAQVG